MYYTLQLKLFGDVLTDVNLLYIELFTHSKVISLILFLYEQLNYVHSLDITQDHIINYLIFFVRAD